MCSVVATNSPVIFTGTGEQLDEFKVFDVIPFVSHLLGAFFFWFLSDWIEAMPNFSCIFFAALVVINGWLIGLDCVISWKYLLFSHVKTLVFFI